MHPGILPDRVPVPGANKQEERAGKKNRRRKKKGKGEAKPETPCVENPVEATPVHMSTAQARKKVYNDAYNKSLRESKKRGETGAAAIAAAKKAANEATQACILKFPQNPNT